MNLAKPDNIMCKEDERLFYKKMKSFLLENLPASTTIYQIQCISSDWMSKVIHVLENKEGKY